ncbi:uncharacterized protein LOC120270705 [Dioscorea cayenensis subsp. rotundata]|uniref:Uncharacterized protein LOC120270705 n=1 Tax=Dioscorea cayennensis subsp. rotundata TaxID=55577 RepID=A0AB40C5N7_DIOCR|nr:uncharacterized protein LOC120270705 [Dioscorea cayenensis subsp. rotundata]
MRNLASCLSEHAVRISDSSCSGAGNNKNISLAIFDRNSFQNSVTCLYKTRLISTAKELFFKLTWSKTNTGPSLSVSIDDNTQVLREMEGKQSYKHGGLVISIHWDFSSARYTCYAPDPVDNNFYVIVMADSEFALLLGDLSTDYVKMFENTCSRDNGKVHEIMIKCKGDSWDVKNSGLSVWVDKKKVVHEQRLYWNFRGNQVMFVDGLPVDFMWDFHDWWFGGPSGCAVFVFRTRSPLESRPWLEEDELQKEQSFSGFSLLIQALKSP